VVSSLIRLVLLVVGLHVSDRGGKYGFVYKSRQNVYRALRRQGMSKSHAARISNAGRVFAQRSRMAKKAARTRKRRGGH
jgi:hypothetical protein